MNGPVTPVARADARALPLADSSVDAIVCDPPYALGFMGREWDSFGDVGRGARARIERAAEVTPTGQGHTTSAGPYLAAGVDSLRSAGRPFQAWCEDWAREAWRVAKPGAHLLAFGGTRTYHRLACAIEDAGWEIRDSIGCLTWMYASGFPKSRDVSKAIDAEAGAVREVIGERTYAGGHVQRSKAPRFNGSQYADGAVYVEDEVRADTAPATEDAARWQGWGTALKPAWEPIIVARKPLAGTVAGNVLAYGTGALNVDGCRVEANGERYGGGARASSGYSGISGYQGGFVESAAVGRWPTNLVLVHHPDCADRCVDGCHVADLDAQSGVQAGGVPRVMTSRKSGTGAWNRGDSGMFDAGKESWVVDRADSGGASRFYPVFRFQAKAPTSERPVIIRDGQRLSHPTVKPLELMRWLVRLVTPAGGLVLDPFCGSGPTLEAALIEGARPVGFDTDPDAMEWTTQRLAKPLQPDLFGS